MLDEAGDNDAAENARVIDGDHPMQLIRGVEAHTIRRRRSAGMLKHMNRSAAAHELATISTTVFVHLAM